MANHRRINGNGRIPSGNGDPFRSFIIDELVALRGFREEQREFNAFTTNILTDVSRAVAGLLTRQARQDRINRLILKEFKHLRRRKS